MEAAGDVVVEKLMSLDHNEFVVSLVRVLGNEVETAAREGGAIAVPVGLGSVQITFVELPNKTFGGLLELPQAHVTLRFRDVEEEARAAFVNEFDLVFQRGGG